MLIRTIQTDTLFSSVYDLRSSMGYAAAETAASAIRAVLERKETANVIFSEPFHNLLGVEIETSPFLFIEKTPDESILLTAT